MPQPYKKNASFDDNWLEPETCEVVWLWGVITEWTLMPNSLSLDIKNSYDRDNQTKATLNHNTFVWILEFEALIDLYAILKLDIKN